MKGYAKPTTEIVARIAELRQIIRDIYAKAKDREFTRSEERKVEKAAHELHRIEGGE